MLNLMWLLADGDRDSIINAYRRKRGIQQCNLVPIYIIGVIRGTLLIFDDAILTEILGIEKINMLLSEVSNTESVLVASVPITIYKNYKGLSVSSSPISYGVGLDDIATLSSETGNVPENLLKLLEEIKNEKHKSRVSIDNRLRGDSVK